jgi:hypothetical protein
MTPEQKEEQKRYRAEKEALQKRIDNGTITGQEAAAEQKRLHDWYERFKETVIGRDGIGNGSV